MLEPWVVETENQRLRAERDSLLAERDRLRAERDEWRGAVQDAVNLLDPLKPVALPRLIVLQVQALKDANATLRNRIDNIRSLLTQALSLAAEGWSYAGDYFRTKYEVDAQLDELRQQGGIS